MCQTTIHKILVADDNEILGSSIARHLHRQGFNVTKTNELDLAKDLIMAAEQAGQPFDLVISDILMQNRSGISFILWLHAEHPEVAVLVVSGFGNADLLESLLRPDRDSFRKKPVLPQEIVGAIFCMEKKKRARFEPGEVIPCEC
ncbi:response regulator [Thiovibrio frasassiensis]|uniref:Response regulator n=1 Tax=Thiovibrio frasassiensis TaxID=2984131 RepID=A0A9X4MDH3_9BACT|nr:response regulator [Thiovibrio frasassiensis]MDG4475336.1 response regulator [Thiovibrio frasassiensis]